MREITKTLQEYVEKNILPLYDSVDNAHGPKHIRTVMENSLQLAEEQDVDIDMVYAIAAYHDIGVRFGREGHEKNSGKWLMEDENLTRWFSPDQRETMREAVEDHRASRKEPPRSIYGCIVSEADRDLVPEHIVERCMEYGLEKSPELSSEEQVERSLRHIQEKYGEGGYLQLWMACPKNERGLAVLREGLKTGELRRRCREYLDGREGRL